MDRGPHVGAGSLTPFLNGALHPGVAAEIAAARREEGSRPQLSTVDAA
jgi:hypothetical protein